MNYFSLKKNIPLVLSFVMLSAGIILQNYISQNWFNGKFQLIFYILAYLPVAIPVLKESLETIKKGDLFNEFTLMCTATIGAFTINQYQEAVGVMLFYSIGELFQDAAVTQAKINIKALLDVRPSLATVLRNNKYETINASEVKVGEKVQIKVGEKVPLDGIIVNQASRFNTSAITGESNPKKINIGEEVLAGMLNLEKVIEIKTTKNFENSSISKILEMVQNASTKKAKIELLIRKLAKIYTPIVFFLALGIIIFPMLFVNNYIFSEWLYRGLIFLVISCPCALIISIPLGYFGGLGLASKHGILFKGANYLEIMMKINTIVMDKTGTITKGVFKVQEIVSNQLPKDEFMQMLIALEKNSNHPIAKAITEFTNEDKNLQATDIEEISGMGIIGIIDNKKIIAGNTKLLQHLNIEYDIAINNIVETIIVVAINNTYSGYVTIADEIKDHSIETIKELNKIGITQTIMLSGDKNSITQKIANKIGVSKAFGELLPENKLEKIEELKTNPKNIIAFVGDGINDAPALALSDIGIAMGAMGSDVAIETADVIIQNDNPYQIITAIKISKATKKVITQNIALAFGVKIIVLCLGATGHATMWEAVFADVGVALLAVLNAVRIQKLKFNTI